ncbi:MAG: hypothetical protein GOV01_00915 [Candidatus Altiarchaeota archaeon]|nr:hypothetical protein [Candidatus Altiarchaeota archaeon]
MLSAELLLFLPVIVLFSIIASYSDFKHKKIPNSLILRMLGVSIILNLVYFRKTQLGNLFFYLIFVLVSLLVAIGLWLLDFWKAGDVKFYFALSTLVHPSNTSRFLLPLFAFLILSFVITLIEVILTRKFKFEPKFSIGLILPVVLAPFMEFLGASALPAVFLVYFIGTKIKKVLQIFAILTIPVLILYPQQAFSALLVTFGFFLLMSLKFEGETPSAPMLSASFIYLLVFGKL